MPANRLVQTAKWAKFPAPTWPAKKRAVMVSAKAGFNEMAKTTSPRAAFLFANTNEDKTFGFLLSGAFSKRKLNEEGFSTVRWDNGPSSGGWCAPTGVTANPSNSTATTCGPAAQGVPRLVGTPENIAAYNAASSAANFSPRLPRYGRLTHDQEPAKKTSWKPSLSAAPRHKGASLRPA